MKLQLQVAAIMAVALFSANTADAAAGDCAVANFSKVMAMAGCMTASGEWPPPAACTNKCTDCTDECKTCVEGALSPGNPTAAGNPGPCFPAPAAGDCTDADAPTFVALAGCMTAAGDDDDAQAACMAALSNACLVCTMVRGDGGATCFAAAAAGDCVGADMTAITTKDTCARAAGPDPVAGRKCETAMLAAIGAKCMICMGQKEDHFACYKAAAAGDCVGADMTAMTTMDKCSTAAGRDAGAAAACSAAMSAALTPKCMVCMASTAAAARRQDGTPTEHGANDMACFDLAAMATTECCKEGGGLDDADKVGASVECLTAAVMILGAADLEPPEADCGDDPTPATVAAACKAWIKPKILGEGKECQGPPTLGLASTSSVPFAASVALVLVALRLH